MRLALLALVALPSLAHAQPGLGYPQPGAPDMPRNLDPGATAAPPPAAPPPAPAQKPNVVVVNPKGEVTYAPDQNAPTQTGYYADTGAAPAGEEPPEVHTGPVPELHVVRRGDTLWDICWFYFNDPWQWPRVWSYNPQITNPHWIYPGDLVRLLPRGMFASEDTGMKAPEKGPEKAPDVVPPPQRRNEVGLRQIAFVEKSDLDKSITIDGSVDEKVLLGPRDQVYLSYPEGKPPQVGKRYSIYVPDNSVKANGKEVGAYVRLLGTLDVTEVKQDKRAKGVIVEANQEIERGQKVGPLIKQYKTVPPVAPKVDAQGQIIAMLRQAQLIGTGELVFVDLGRASGLEVGNQMFVIRRGDAYPVRSESTIGQDDRRFPARALGRIIIVEVGEKMSVGLVDLSVQEMGVGDLVLMQKAK